jgi:flavin-dependent dehydrogenase
MPDISERVDVAILGGGIAGLTLARQLRRADAGLRIAVFERQRHPAPEAAHKVGESSVEVQAHYLRDVLALQEHLDQDQLHKFGLRMFFSHKGNHDITHRVEYGQVSPAPLPSYQLDRGRLENALGEMIASDGVAFHQNCKVGEVELSATGEDHVVHVHDGDAEHAVRARWVVDATGRAGLLRRRLGLAKPLGHRANASWFRIEHVVDVQQWSTDEEWRTRITDGDRRLSTNHLMGPGYWVWLIPLASGSTSVGIVAENDAYRFDEFNTLDRTLNWLDEHEPQCAAEVRRHQSEIQDFRVMRDYAYGCQQVYSEDRWCLTGEAGVAIDPLYSSGGDLMAISNGLITDLVMRDRRGEDCHEKAIAHSQVYLVLSDIWLAAYENQYPLMGNPKVMVAKVIWDTIIYWAVPGLLFFHDKFPSLADNPAAFANLLRVWSLHARVQRFLREWHALDNVPAADTFADPYSLLDFILDLHNEMAAGLSDEELMAKLTANVVLLEQVAGQLASTVIALLAQRDTDEATRVQLDRWRADELLREVIDRYAERDPVNPITSDWITLGAQPSAVGS